MLNPKDFKKDADRVIRWIDNYLQQLEDYPVKSMLSPGEVYDGIPPEAPEKSESLEDIMKDLDEVILPGMTHWQHPNFHAYFPANSSMESMLAEFITSAMGAQCMIWDTSPAAAELEQRMAEWLREALGLPGHMEGVIQDSASSATLVALITAREVATSFKSNEEGVPAHLRIYCSEETHSSVEKAAGVCGIGRRNLVKIPVDEGMCMEPRMLEKAILADLAQGRKPCAVVAAMGTTGTVAVDPLKKIAAICSRHQVWLHVDAAFAGSALLLPEYRWMSEGMEQADSFVFNPHKWLFTNFDCSLYYVKDPASLIRSFEILPEYLKTGTRGAVNDYRDWGVPLGRRFRALKLWFVLRSHGLDGLREKLREQIRLSHYFGEQIRLLPEMELMGDPFLIFTAFRYRPEGSADDRTLDEINQKALASLNAGGKIFLTHTRIRGRYVLRMLIGQTYVTREHVDRALKEIQSRCHA